VPIILLASLKGPLDSRYTSFYGIVDYLKMPFSSEELIKKTEKILSSQSHDFVESEEDIGSLEEETVLTGERPVSLKLNESDEEETAADEEMPVNEGPAEFDKTFADISEVGKPNEDYSYRDSNEDLRGGMFKRGGIRRKQPSLLGPVVVVLAVLAIVAAGFLSYKFFISVPQVKAPVAVITPKAVQQQVAPVLPHPEQQKTEQQKQEQPVAEVKPAGTKEVPKGLPAAVPAVKTASKPFYSVQLGAFKSEAGAEALVKTYEGKGYEAFIHTAETKKDKGPFHRVLIGKFENRKEAVKLAAQVETKEKIKTTVFSEGEK